MSRLASAKTVQFDLGNGEYIEYRDQVSFSELEKIMTGLDTKNEAANLKMAIPLLELAVTGWRILDDEGQEIPFSKEKVSQLGSQTVIPVFTEMVGRYFPEKKNEPASTK